MTRVMRGATYVTEKVTLKNNAIHPAGFTISQVTETWTVRRKKIEEEVRVEEEEEMNPILVRGDNQRKGGIHLMPKRKATRSQVKVTGLGMIVQVSLVQTRIDLVSQDQDQTLAQIEKKTLHQEERSQRKDKTRIDITKVIEL